MELKIDNTTMEALVKTEIQARVSELLLKNSTRLVQEVVRKAFEEKQKDAYGYGRESIIENTLNKMVRDEAHAAMQEWIESVKPEIRKLMFARLSDKKLGLAAQVSDKLVAGLAGDLTVRVVFGSNS